MFIYRYPGNSSLFYRWREHFVHYYQCVCSLRKIKSSIVLHFGLLLSIIPIEILKINGDSVKNHTIFYSRRAARRKAATAAHAIISIQPLVEI